MDPESQKNKIKETEPLSKDILFASNKSVCIIPLKWWNSWCKYVSFYGIGENTHPGDIKTDMISLLDTKNHAYISKNAWKLFKSWYNTGKKLEVFIVNNIPDTNPYEIQVNLDDYVEKKVQISLGWTEGELKSYLCKKFSKNPEFYKIMVKGESGYTRKLRKMDAILDRREINNASIIMLKTNKRQIDYTDKVITMDDYEFSVPYGPEYPKNREIEMKEYHPVEETVKNIEEIREKVEQALKGEKTAIKLKSLKKIKICLLEIYSKLDKNN